MMDDLSTYAENTWCVGCGNFGILQAIKDALKVLEGRGRSRDAIVMTAGIGCHAKIFDYLGLSGFYSLHGRSMSTAQGIKVANPDLTVISFEGDGSAFGAGIEHMIFSAKRNMDITVFLHHNSVYGLTTGQASPLSDKGFKGRSTPRGTPEAPLDAAILMLDSGASFIARGYTARLPQLTDLMVRAVEHKGFSFVDILQPCVSFNNTYGRWTPIVEEVKATARNRVDAWNLMRKTEKIPIGVLYEEDLPVWERQVPLPEGTISTPREQRVIAVKRLLGMLTERS